MPVSPSTGVPSRPSSLEAVLPRFSWQAGVEEMRPWQRFMVALSTLLVRSNACWGGKRGLVRVRTI
jgi:hypothetical protein